MTDLAERIKRIRTLLTPNRIRILRHIEHEEKCVCEMVSDLSIKHSLLSHHLRVLARADYIKSRKEGRHIKYSILDKKREFIREVLDLIDYNIFN